MQVQMNEIRERIRERAERILNSMRPTFADYHGYKGVIKARNMEEAVLKFMSTYWSTPPALALICATQLGLDTWEAYKVGLVTYRKSNGQIRAYFHVYDRDTHPEKILPYTVYWDFIVKRVGDKEYEVELINYGVVVNDPDRVRPIIIL